VSEQANDITRITEAISGTLGSRSNGRRTVASLSDEIQVLGRAVTELAHALVEVNRESFGRVLDLLDGMADRIGEARDTVAELDKRVRKLEKGSASAKAKATAKHKPKPKAKAQKK
jgi:chromosome segregation ATPase